MKPTNTYASPSWCRIILQTKQHTNTNTTAHLCWYRRSNVDASVPPRQTFPLNDLSFPLRNREVTGKALSTTLEVTLESAGGSSAVCPWDSPTATAAKPPEKESTVSVSVCPWDDGDVKLPSER